jgi:beta-alanine degradation protein BauB
MTQDPVETNPDHYRVIFENDAVRVLAYRDSPGDRSVPHEHPNSVMYTLSAFERRLRSGARAGCADAGGGCCVVGRAGAFGGEHRRH